MASGEAKKPVKGTAWERDLAVLEAALKASKPDGLGKIAKKVADLESEASALALQRELIYQTFARDQADAFDKIDEIEARISRAGTALPRRRAWMDHRLETIKAQMNDLSRLAKGVKKTPLDVDIGPTPEVAVRPEDTWASGLSPERCRAAEDIRMGYLVRAGRTYDIGQYEVMPSGQGEIGDRRARLATRYRDFVHEMTRRRRPMIYVLDVVCDNMTVAECATKRKAEPPKVLERLGDDLQLYADTFPPLDHKAE